jgi:hypothetical protein
MGRRNRSSLEELIVVIGSTAVHLLYRIITSKP